MSDKSHGDKEGIRAGVWCGMAREGRRPRARSAGSWFEFLAADGELEL
ncbi:hypothetical protein [Bifidobacterium myosotis]|nr:hypothetical protein [Bifidobacterium myosotis]